MIKIILVIETVSLITLVGSYLGLRTRVKYLEHLIDTYEKIVIYKDDLAFYKEMLGE